MIHQNFDEHWKAMRETMEKRADLEVKWKEFKDHLKTFQFYDSCIKDHTCFINIDEVLNDE